MDRPHAPTPSAPSTQVGVARPSSARPARRGFTLVEALIASVILTAVASTAAMSVAVGSAVESQNRLSVLAMQAAELQMGTALELSYDTMYTCAGTEVAGKMLAPPRPGAARRDYLPAAFSQLSRTTTVTDENRTFTQYYNYTVTGKHVEVTVYGPDGSALAKLVRFRGKAPTT